MIFSNPASVQGARTSQTTDDKRTAHAISQT